LSIANRLKKIIFIKIILIYTSDIVRVIQPKVHKVAEILDITSENLTLVPGVPGF